MCSPGHHEKEKAKVIMSTMHVSFSVLETWQACTAYWMSLTESGSIWKAMGLLFCSTETGVSVQG